MYPHISVKNVATTDKSSEQAKAVRELFLLYVNGEGAVTWQEDVKNRSGKKIAGNINQHIFCFLYELISTILYVCCLLSIFLQNKKCSHLHNGW